MLHHLRSHSPLVDSTFKAAPSAEAMHVFFPASCCTAEVLFFERDGMHALPTYKQPFWLIRSVVWYSCHCLQGNTGSAAATASLGPGQAVGIPVYNIPMQEVVIGPRVDGTAAGAGTPSSQPPPYWYDADCLPPAGSYPYGAPGSAAVGAAAGPTGGVQGPYPVGPYPTQAAAYPPQPAAATAGAGADGFVLGQPVTGIPAMAAPQMGAAAGQAGGRASMEASGHVGAAAGAAAAAGAGAVGAGGQQPPR